MKVLITFKAILLGVACLGLFTSNAQIDLPDLSPRSVVKQNVGFGQITVDYSRPCMRGRVIFGELVPFNELWRTGADECTTIAFTEEVFLYEYQVPAGKYSLFSIPGEDDWTIILNQATNLWGTYGYDKNKDFLRFKVIPEILPFHVESFTIDIGDLTQTTAKLILQWENTKVAIQIGTNADARIISDIQTKLKDPMVDVGNTYYSSANYYLMTNRDLDQAMTWIDKAIEINGESGYYLTLKAKIFAQQYKYDKAVQYARRAVEQAKKEENKNLVRMNEKYMESWKKMSGDF